MTVIKCKMCGGNIVPMADRSYGQCDSCGSIETLPKVDDEQRAAQFNRGNHFRQMGDFEKALAIYERIIEEDDADAEAHWCCALCRFGIEYVQDPATQAWLPTCHRLSFDSFLDDIDYRAALQYSEGTARAQYQKNAEKIAEVQRGILATSQNEQPFDVFICYKETDETGARTKDSILAQEIYYELTDLGLRVFFSRITMEEKPGVQFEPYIFAALNSAKVMLVIGTKAEYMNAVWVKNEWSRFLALMRKERSRLLIPCYRDMNPYDLPEQLAVLQAYDMEKIGFLQDLIRGVNKVLGKSQAAAQPMIGPAAQPDSVHHPEVDALLERGKKALATGNWREADDYFERALDRDVECAEAYMGEFLALQKAASLESYLDSLTQSARNAAPTKKEAVAYASERIQDTVNKYTFKKQKKNVFAAHEIANLYAAFDRTYSSVTDRLTALAADAKETLESNRLLKRARQFAKGAYLASIESDLNGFVDNLDQMLDNARAADAKAIAAIEEEYSRHLAKTDATVRRLYSSRVLKRRLKKFFFFVTVAVLVLIFYQKYPAAVGAGLVVLLMLWGHISKWLN